MQTTGNTILITGGGSGIGRALAEAFHRAGNEVVIAGRRQSALDEVTAANPGMKAITLDIADAAAVREFAARVVAAHPALNVVINNAGIMRPEDATAGPGHLDDAEAMVTTNVLGPIRLTAALLPHLRSRPTSTVMMVSSGLAFVPLAATPTYCATKAAIHSYALSLRHQLRDSTTRVIELAPPYVQTELLGAHQATDPNAMPLGEFIAEVMGILRDQPDADEVIVGRCKPLRSAAEGEKFAGMFQGLNSMDFSAPPGH